MTRRPAKTPTSHWKNYGTSSPSVYYRKLVCCPYLSYRTVAVTSAKTYYYISVFAGENEDEKLNELMYEAWRINRDCKLLRDGLQGLSWDGQ